MWLDILQSFLKERVLTLFIDDAFVDVDFLLTIWNKKKIQ